MAIQRNSLFPEMEDPRDDRELIGLKIVKVTSSLHGAIKVIQCEDAKGEIHEITFETVDASYIAIKLDDQAVLNIETEVYDG